MHAAGSLKTAWSDTQLDSNICSFAPTHRGVPPDMLSYLQLMGRIEYSTKALRKNVTVQTLPAPFTISFLASRYPTPAPSLMASLTGFPCGLMQESQQRKREVLPSNKSKLLL